VVERGLQLTVDPQADEEIEDEGTEGQGVYCVTCGHEVSTRRAIKHMENCFNKVQTVGINAI
jgi:COMPASS component SPP1